MSRNADIARLEDAIAMYEQELNVATDQADIKQIRLNLADAKAELRLIRNKKL